MAFSASRPSVKDSQYDGLTDGNRLQADSYQAAARSGLEYQTSAHPLLDDKTSCGAVDDNTSGGYTDTEHTKDPSINEDSHQSDDYNTLPNQGRRTIDGVAGQNPTSQAQDVSHAPEAEPSFLSRFQRVMGQFNIPGAISGDLNYGLEGHQGPTQDDPTTIPDIDEMIRSAKQFPVSAFPAFARSMLDAAEYLINHAIENYALLIAETECQDQAYAQCFDSNGSFNERLWAIFCTRLSNTKKSISAGSCRACAHLLVPVIEWTEWTDTVARIYPNSVTPEPEIRRRTAAATRTVNNLRIKLNAYAVPSLDMLKADHELNLRIAQQRMKNTNNQMTGQEQHTSSEDDQSDDDELASDEIYAKVVEPKAALQDNKVEPEIQVQDTNALTQTQQPDMEDHTSLVDQNLESQQANNPEEYMDWINWDATAD